MTDEITPAASPPKPRPLLPYVLAVGATFAMLAISYALTLMTNPSIAPPNIGPDPDAISPTNIRYLRDGRADICYAVIGRDQAKRSVTSVPCTETVLSLTGFDDPGLYDGTR